jgi:hypothetical protein
MKQIFIDTLKSNGKWSRKSLTVLVTMTTAIGLGIFIAISDKILNTVVNPYAIQVFNSLLLFAGTLMGVTEAGKKFINKNEINN